MVPGQTVGGTLVLAIRKFLHLGCPTHPRRQGVIEVFAAGGNLRAYTPPRDARTAPPAGAFEVPRRARLCKLGGGGCTPRAWRSG